MSKEDVKKINGWEKMTVCEWCGSVVSRRISLEGSMVCSWCYYVANLSKENLVKDYIRIRNENGELRKKLVALRQKAHYNSPFSAIPPKEILQRAMIALDLGKYYTEFSKVLGDYYGIDGPPYYESPKEVPPDAIACYYPSRNEVYCTKQNLSYENAFHEFYHALHKFGIVTTKHEEKDAELYAKGCLAMLGEKGD